jgi:hypothetical protein
MWYSEAFYSAMGYVIYDKVGGANEGEVSK